jgi:hypothetical protein
VREEREEEAGERSMSWRYVRRKGEEQKGNNSCLLDQEQRSDRE